MSWPSRRQLFSTVIWVTHILSNQTIQYEIFQTKMSTSDFRLHEKESCFQFGSVFNGMVRERKANTGSCNGMRPKRDSWFTMRVQVHSKNEAQLYINNVLIASHVASIPWYPRGGVVVANGFKNIIMFREFRIFAKK